MTNVSKSLKRLQYVALRTTTLISCLLLSPTHLLPMDLSHFTQPNPPPATILSSLFAFVRDKPSLASLRPLILVKIDTYFSILLSWPSWCGQSWLILLWLCPWDPDLTETLAKLDLLWSIKVEGSFDIFTIDGTTMETKRAI